MSDIPAPRSSAGPSVREGLLRNARLVSGLVLMLFVTTHLANHALNLISLEAAEKGRLVFLAAWRNPLGTILLYGSLSVHFTLALLALYRRQAAWCEVRPLDAPVCRDPDDDWVLATALAGQADAIVTGDADLLVLDVFQGIAILSPRQFIERWHGVS